MYDVQVGDLWEAEGRLFWIVSISPFLDYELYEYFEFSGENLTFMQSRLTIKYYGFPDLWTKLA